MTRLPLLLLALLLHIGMWAQSPAPRHWNYARGYSPFSRALPDGLLLQGSGASPAIDSCRLARPFGPFSLTFRGSASGGPWGFFLDDVHTGRLWVTVIPVEQPGPISSAPALRIEATPQGSASPAASATIDAGLDLHSGPNIWRIASSDGTLTVSAGNRSLSPRLELPVSGTSLAAFGFVAAPGATLRVQDISLIPIASTSTLPTLPPEELSRLPERLAASRDSLEGYWTVFDRTLNEDLLRMGGDYRFALVRDTIAARYLLVYLGGARVNAGKWHPGMIKASFTEDPFPGIYSVGWTDASGAPLGHDIKAQLSEPGLLLIQFPYHSSQLRLRRLPKTQSAFP